eukprot:6197566-Pleurochrysis_carterae.AAC.6
MHQTVSKSTTASEQQKCLTEAVPQRRQSSKRTKCGIKHALRSQMARCCGQMNTQRARRKPNAEWDDENAEKSLRSHLKTLWTHGKGPKERIAFCRLLGRATAQSLAQTTERRHLVVQRLPRRRDPLEHGARPARHGA